MSRVTGTIEKYNCKPTKKSGWFAEGWQIDGKWYNNITKFPKEDNAGREVSFTVDENSKFPTSVVMGTVKFLTKGTGNSSVSGSNSDSRAIQGSTSHDNQKEVPSVEVDRFEALEELINKKFKSTEAALKEIALLTSRIHEQNEKIKNLIKSSGFAKLEEDEDSVDEEIPF